MFDFEVGKRLKLTVSSSKGPIEREGYYLGSNETECILRVYPHTLMERKVIIPRERIEAVELVR